MIAIVDYGLGNINAFVNIYKYLSVPIIVAKNANDLVDVTHLILPGVGAFDWAMKQLNVSGMRSKLDQLVLEKKIPVLGVCVGMQIMAHRSEEGHENGLGWIDAEVRRFDKAFNNDYRIDLPHMGWNEVIPKNDHEFFEQIDSNNQFYFLHSFFFAPAVLSDILAITEYGNHFPSAVKRDNIYGVQFHPEKSHGQGVQLLKNFIEL